jgi:hypothetical protein
VKLTTRLHLVPRSKNAWSYTSTPQYVFLAWYLVKHKEYFSKTILLVFIVVIIVFTNSLSFLLFKDDF